MNYIVTGINTSIGYQLKESLQCDGHLVHGIYERPEPRLIQQITDRIHGIACCSSTPDLSKATQMISMLTVSKDLSVVLIPSVGLESMEDLKSTLSSNRADIENLISMAYKGKEESVRVNSIRPLSYPTGKIAGLAHYILTQKTRCITSLFRTEGKTRSVQFNPHLNPINPDSPHHISL